MSDNHEGKVQRNRAIRSVDHSCSGAIRIDSVTPARLRLALRPPFSLKSREVDPARSRKPELTRAYLVAYSLRT